MLRKKFLAVCTASTLALGVAGAPAAQAQQSGLVNVSVNNVLNRNDVGIGVAAGVAAQICGVTAQVGVIARQVARTGQFECRNDSGTQTVTITQ